MWLTLFITNRDKQAGDKGRILIRHAGAHHRLARNTEIGVFNELQKPLAIAADWRKDLNRGLRVAEVAALSSLPQRKPGPLVHRDGNINRIEGDDRGQLTLLAPDQAADVER